MKLKNLEITGFKSFHEKAKIDFPLGISAIVGPNGCGKSNIVDAMRWVMGEQSVKQLRGKSMEDVIFSGTSGNAALNMAEVSLTLINDNGSAPEELKDYAEIMVTKQIALLQNYPNPFNPETWLPYQLADAGDVKIQIYDVSGRLVRTLTLGYKHAGYYQDKASAAYWNGRNETGEKSASGVYFYSIQAGNFTATRKMLLIE